LIAYEISAGPHFDEVIASRRYPINFGRNSLSMAAHYQRKVPARQMPVHFAKGADFVPGQEPPHTDRNVFRVIRAATGRERFLSSNRMRNAMTLCVSQDRLHKIRRYFELLGDFIRTQAVVEVIDNRADRHTCTAQHRRAALHAWLDFD
jgi:hypothetical protein